MKNRKQLSILIGLLIAREFFTIFIQSYLDPIRFASQSFFVFDLIGKTYSWSYLWLNFFDLGNVILLWLIGKKIFANRFAFTAAAVYAICPWGSYLAVASSFYIYLSFIILLIFYSLVIIYSGGKQAWVKILLIGAIITAMYSSFTLFITLPILFVLIILFQVILFKDLKKTLIFICILMLPLVFIVIRNQTSFSNIRASEIKLFADPGLLNMVNSYQGAGKEAGFGNIAKVSENRYIFAIEYIFLKYIKSLTPTNYFTQQEKLLNFSFTPPIYLGFLIPFLYGLYNMFQNSILRKLFLLSTLLIIPSIFSKQIVDLNRQILFAPVVIILISYGIIKFLETRKKITFFLTITLVLVIFQFVVTISDIKLREKDRYIKYYGQNYEIGKQ